MQDADKWVLGAIVTAVIAAGSRLAFGDWKLAGIILMLNAARVLLRSR